MHRLSLLPTATAAVTFIAAAAATAPPLLSSSMPALQLGSPALLAARQGPRPPPWLRCGGGGARRGLFCSVEAARRGDDEAEEEKRRGGGGRAAAERRLRGGELLAIPGVGPRNLRKLVDNGFEGVAQLKQLYRDKFFGRSREKMVEFLQSSVGIIHKNHAEDATQDEGVHPELRSGYNLASTITQNNSSNFYKNDVSIPGQGQVNFI